MSERFTLFVYGQLRRGEIGYRRLDLEHRTDWLGRTGIRGQLYNLGDYPGLVLGGRGIVHGELLGFDDPALWPSLDDYETHDPEQPALSEYLRLETDLLDGSRAWTYVYNQPIEDRPLIAGGNWHSV